ncbi:reverse transcriptase domain-containing protein [Tanacetum coccineum]
MAEADEDKTAFFAGKGVIQEDALRSKECRSNLPKTGRQGRIAKWAIELGEHEIKFKDRDSVKRQIPTYFLVETPPEEDNKAEINKVGTNKKVQNWKACGSCILTELQASMAQTTINEAEYEVLLAGLRITEEMEIKNLAIFVDSQLVVNQLKGLFEARQLAIKQYLGKTKEILKGFNTYSMEHIRSNQKNKANALSKLASMTFEHLTKEVLVEVLAKRSINNKEISMIIVEIEEK